MVLVDVTNSARDPANSGVVRVTRQLTKRLYDDSRLDMIFVRWSTEQDSYELTDPCEGFLSYYGGPVNFPAMLSTPETRRTSLERLLLATHPECTVLPILFLPEVILDGTSKKRTEWARRRGLLISFVVHDLIPMNNRQYCSQSIIDEFPSYLAEAVSADQIIAISHNTLDDIKAFARARATALPSSSIAIWLPAQFGSTDRVSRPAPSARDEIRILCVSTLEPRKNHRRLMRAFANMIKRHPQHCLTLVLVGNSYAGAEDIAEEIDAAVARGLPVERRRVLNDDELRREYASARFTVYPSLVEGFGLPILESLWLGKPCICSSGGVMAELAGGGGCLTVDVSDVDALSVAIEQLAFDDAVYHRLVTDLAKRPLESWTEYSVLIADSLVALGNPDPGLSLTSRDDLTATTDETRHSGLSVLLRM
jgi:glycosyltransferase involved in cell wall biosynthesis